MEYHYLDNAATTRPSDAALEGMRQAEQYYGNPSSVHGAGMEANRFLTACRGKIAAALGLSPLAPNRLILTSSGTEANNIAILGCAYAKKRKPVGNSLGTILLSDGEHPSMEKPAQRLESEGYTVVRIPTAKGVLDLAALETALTDAVSPVIFAGFMLVNNETGALYDVRSAAALVKRHHPGALVHCDAVQGFMKTRFTPKTLGVDTLTVSAHKIHGTRGAGALYIGADVEKQKKIVPVMPGGGQEFGYRSGTENLFAIGAFAHACQEEQSRFAANRAAENTLRETLLSSIAPLADEGVQFNIPEGTFVPGILNLSLPAIRSEIMLNYLSGKGIYVSAGSACSAHAHKESAALKAFGLSPEAMDCALRISFDHTNTEGDILALAAALKEGIAGLQRKR
ncbi:MAG: cysteine desulfurase [Clostridia bacterium]|nr:cysteine desulfurase [Clostridia bacterium]